MSKEGGPKEDTNTGCLSILMGNTISSNNTVKLKSCKSSGGLGEKKKKKESIYGEVKKKVITIIICSSKGPLSKNPKPCYKYVMTAWGSKC